VTLTEIKSHLRLNENDESHDANLTLLIQGASERLEHDIDRQLFTSTYEQTQFSFGGTVAELRLRTKAVTQVVSVKYIDTDGTEQTMLDTDYTFDAGRGSLFPTAGTQWPEVQQDNPNAITVELVAGYGSDSSCMPRLLKAAIMLGVGKWFYDPAQEGSALHSQEIAYEKIVTLLMRSSYP